MEFVVELVHRRVIYDIVVLMESLATNLRIIKTKIFTISTKIDAHQY